MQNVATANPTEKEFSVKTRIQKGTFPDPRSHRCFVVPVYEGDSELSPTARRADQSSGGWISELLRSREFEGKHCQLELLHTGDADSGQRIVLIGLGKRCDFDLDRVRGAYAKAAQFIRSSNLLSFSTALDFGPSSASIGDLTEAVVEGTILGSYQFTPYKTVQKEEIRQLREMTIVVKDGQTDAARTAAANAEIICRAVSLARDMISTPGNEMTPSHMAGQAILAAKGRAVSVKVLDEQKMQRLGMNALLGVASGSKQPPRFIILEYRGGRKSDRPLVLVGKGLTFDSGGISLKPAEKMDEMKSDMSGGAAVICAIMAAVDLELPVNLVGLVPATENMPSGRALKPGDILKSLSGQTIEVVNTDAEGRLILADALTYAGRYKPAAIIDLATLTGACVIALGDYVTGMMGTDEALKEKIRKAADFTGEKVWELPLWEEYDEQIKSDIADVKNAGGRPAGTITAAAFLKKFVGDFPWAHLDIAGPAWLSKDRSYIPKGASGVGVRLLVRLLRTWNGTVC